MNARFQFSDSIYQSIAFGNTLPSKLSYLIPSDAFDPVQVIQTPEFARLSFIRRHGLGWLVYPAATQTLLQYSVGNWGFARLAELLIQVITGNGRRKPLSLWLKDIELRAEFYLSLLCQEIGCAPLSAVLEVDKLSHVGSLIQPTTAKEKRSAALLGDCDLTAWRRTAEHRYGLTATLGNVLKMTAPEQPVCVSVVSFILTNDEEYLEGCSHRHRLHVGFLKDLVRGLLHIRKLDHYARDSYISTMRQFGLNLRGFFEHLTLTPTTRADRIAVTSIDENAINYAAALLMKRKHRVSAKDYSAEVVGIHEMATWAWRVHQSTLRDQPLTHLLNDIWFMEDDQVVELMGNSINTACRRMIQRVRSGNAYLFVGKWQNDYDIEKIIGIVNEYACGVKQGQDTLPGALMRKINGDVIEADDHFDVAKLVVGPDDELLMDHPTYKNNIANLQQIVSQSCLYVFAQDKRSADLLGTEINRLLTMI